MFDRSIPFIGFHTIIKAHESVDALIRLIDEGLAPNGFNTLILEMRFAFRCFPEFSTGAITYEDASRIADVCEKHGIRLVPLLPCLSHQSAGPRSIPYPLFQIHPELLERQGVVPGTEWPDFVLHSWCASNDDVYKYVFPMIDEMAEACRAQAFHIGMDELFDVAVCPKCKDKSPASLYARTIKILHDHLAERGLETMIWGDRLLDAQKMGFSMWEADRFDIHPALERRDEVTRDIIVCDWHYEWHSAGYPSVETLVKEGFFTIPSFWRDEKNAAHFWLHALEAQYLANRYNWTGKLGGMLCTNWRGLDEEAVNNMLASIRGEDAGKGPGADIGRVIREMIPKAEKFHV